jgi:hypothetical protein
MEKLLLNNLEGLSEEALVETIAYEFQIEKSEVQKYEVLIGKIHDYDYESDAYFLLRDRATGVLYEAGGSHCSCMGYEGQWSPAITSKEYLLSAHYAHRNEDPISKFVTELFNQ